MYLTAKLISLSVSRPLCILFIMYSCTSANEGPVSVTTLEGLNAHFHCAGSGTVLVWEVDGLPITDQSIENRNIIDDTVSSSSSGTVQSTLTVPATLVNNGTTVRCFIGSFFNTAVVSNSSTLTIVTNIGPVLNLQFGPSFSSILWDPPATAGVLNLSFSYNVIVTNMNTGQVIVSDTTTNTIYPLPVIKSCQYYTANVTVFYKNHFGDSVVTEKRTQGKNYQFGNLSDAMVASYNKTHCAVFFTVTIQKIGAVVCPDQNLMSITMDDDYTRILATYEKNNITDGDMRYRLFVKSGYICISEVKIVTERGDEVEMKEAYFSSFNVQRCSVSSDQHTSSILVECTFAINSTAPGIVVIQDDQSQYTINKTLQRLLQDSDKGSVNITGLPAGEYSVRVFDLDENQPAYRHNGSFHIIADSDGNTGVASPSPTLSITSTDSSSIVGVIVGCLAVAIVIGILLAGASIILCLCVQKKHGLKTTPMDEKRWTHNTNIYFEGNELRRVTPICGDEHVTPVLAESNYMQTRIEFLSATNAISTDHEKKSDPLYADLQHSSNPPAASVSVGAVQYADIQQQQQSGLQYAEVQHLKKRPAAPIPLKSVQYATTVQVQSNKEDIQNTGPSVSSEAKTEATTSTELSDSQSDVADADESFVGKSEDCIDNGNKTSMVYELARTVVEVAADTWRRAGSLCLDTTNSDTVPPMSSLDETKSGNPSKPVYTSLKNSSSKRNSRELSPTDYAYISDGYKSEKTTHKGGRNYSHLRLRQYD